MITTTVSDSLLQRIRPSVRKQKAYRVGTPDQIEVKLNQNESPFDLPDELKRELIEAFSSIEFNRYPADQPEDLQAALSEHTGHPADGILIGNGSNELTHTLGLTFIERGAPIVLPRPMFSLYESVVDIYGGEVVGIPPRDDLQFDADAILEAVQEHDPALTVLTTPNNPTGLAMDPKDVQRIVEATSGFVLVDEAYVEFHPEGSALPLLEDHDNVLLMRTFSKAFGLAGLRIGYLLGHPDVIGEIMKARLPFMVDRFAEKTAITLLNCPDLVEKRINTLLTSTRYLQQEMEKIEGVEVRPTKANFVIFKPQAEPEVVMDRLAESKVLVRNMGGYGELQGYLRVNAGTEIENKAFLAALELAVKA